MSAAAHSVNEPYVHLNSNSVTAPNWIAWGCESELIIRHGDLHALELFENFTDKNRDWIFGCVGYGFKDLLGNSRTSLVDPVDAPIVHLFKPRNVVRVLNGVEEWLKGSDPLPVKRKGIANPTVHMEPRISRDQYMQSAEALLHEIRKGNIYEVNYCMAFGASAVLPDPFAAWEKLNELTEAPFSAYAHLGNIHILCGSPERFLTKRGSSVFSQPMKGTIRRGKTPEEDRALRQLLLNSAKERSENTMIVDLVRNDLSRDALRGSVHVDEYCAVHTYKTVHQMISTVRCEVALQTSFSQLISHVFPMGSMTGAPKVRAMQLIDSSERQARGFYSGSLGYISPEGDFDWNVVIRTILYNEQTAYLSAMAGSAITAQSDPAAEFEECLLKAQALLNALA